MIDKHLRILIVDAVHAHSLQIEKMLNAMGYYCIATASTAEEGLILSHAGGKKFDVLLAPEYMVRQPNNPTLSLASYGIENAFIYSRTSVNDDRQMTTRGERYYRQGMPEYLVLEWFMARAKRYRPIASWRANEQSPAWIIDELASVGHDPDQRP